jgi:hypothetical protein
MERMLRKLWRPLRLLADLKYIWPELTERQRNDIRESLIYRDKFHESRVTKYAAKLTALANGLREPRNRKLRREVLTFLRHWDKQEPDRAKILASAIGRSRKA